MAKAKIQSICSISTSSSYLIIIQQQYLYIGGVFNPYMAKDSVPSILSRDTELKKYADFLKLRRLRPNTYRLHILRLRKIKNILGKPLLSVRTREELKPLLRWMNSHIKTNASYTAYVSTIRSFYFDFWLEHYEGKKVPLLKARGDTLFQYQPVKPRTVVFSKEQLEVFFKILGEDANPLWKPFFALTYDCGLRLGEVIYASLENLNKEKMYYAVENVTYNGELVDGYAIKYSLKRPDMGRKPPVSKFTLDLIDEWVNKYRPKPSHEMYNSLIFLDNRNVKSFLKNQPDSVKTIRYGKPIYKRLVEKKLKKLIDKCRLDSPDLKWQDFVVHDLRGSFITHQLLSGVPGEVIAKWVGHSSTKPLLPYIRLIEEHLLRKDWKGAIEVKI